MLLAGGLLLGANALLPERREAPARGPGGTPYRVGVSAALRLFPAREARRRAREVRRSGIGWVREDFDWSEAEPRRGERDWRVIDRTVEAAARARLRLLPLVTYTPRWAGPERLGPPRDPADFARFTAAVTARYGPGGTFWRARRDLDGALAPRFFELWNEPYLAIFWRPRPDAAAYARLYAAGVRAGRRANPRARFLLAADTRAEGRPFLEALYDAEPDLPSLTDAISAHPYAFDGSGPDDWTPGSENRHQQVRRIEDLRATMVRRGDGGDPVWITEIGWQTAPNGRNAVTEQQQADHLQRVFELAATRWRPWVRAVFWYSWDGPEQDPFDTQQWFGLRTSAGREKPAQQRLEALLRER